MTTAPVAESISDEEILKSAADTLPGVIGGSWALNVSNANTEKMTSMNRITIRFSNIYIRRFQVDDDGN